MFEFLGSILSFIGNSLSVVVAGVVSIGGYVTMKRFVRGRLRFVDGVHRRGVPLVAGVAGLGVGLLVAAIPIIPFVYAPTAILFGIGIGTGVAAGRRDIKRLPSP